MKIKRNGLLRFFWGFLLWITDRPDYLKYKKSYSTPSLNIAVVKTKCKHRPTLLFFILQKDDHIWTVVISKWMELSSNGFHHWMELWKSLIFCTKLLGIDEGKEKICSKTDDVLSTFLLQQSRFSWEKSLNSRIPKHHETHGKHL